MVSNFPRFFARPDEFTSRPEQAPQGEWFGERVLDRVREAFCGLHGHDNLLQFKQDRMFLKCFSCGHESPGWELNETPPTLVAAADSEQRALVQTQLISERHIA